MKVCWKCRKTIPSVVTTCPECFANQVSPQPSRKFAQTVLAVMGVIFILIVIGVTGRNQTPSTPPAAVDAVPVASRAGGIAPIDPGVYTPYTRETGFRKTFALWGEAGVRRIQKLRENAAATAARNPQCDAVEMVELSSARSTPKTNPVVFVDCANGQRFYMSEADVGGPVSTEKEKGARWSSADLIQRCTEAVRARLNLPSTFDRDMFSVSDYQGTSGNRVIRFTFTAKNRLGADLPASAECIMTTQGEFEVSINET